MQIPEKTVYFIMGQHNTKRNPVVLLEKAIEAGTASSGENNANVDFTIIIGKDYK